MDPMGYVQESDYKVYEYYMSSAFWEDKFFIPCLKLIAKASKNRPFAPKGKDHLPTIHSQGLLLLVSERLKFGDVNILRHKIWYTLPETNIAHENPNVSL